MDAVDALRLTIDVAAGVVVVAGFTFDIDSLPAEAWRNGRGETRPVAADGGADATWRVSIATVTDGAPFSDLAGSDRVFLPLRPDSIELATPGGPLLPGADGAVRFDGALPVVASVPGGSAPALNIISTTGIHRIGITRHGERIAVQIE